MLELALCIVQWFCLDAYVTVLLCSKKRASNVLFLERMVFFNIVCSHDCIVTNIYAARELAVYKAVFLIHDILSRISALSNGF